MRDTENGRYDNFGHLVSNPLTDILDVPGHYVFTPERKRAYVNGTRRFLQYGTDSRFEDINVGTRLAPNPGDLLTLTTAERVPYPVGYDVVATMAMQVSRALESGDAAAGGFGYPDLANFDPATKTYSGSTADGWFWIITAEEGLNRVMMAEVRDGEIVDSTVNKFTKPITVWKRIAQWLNWYDVGPSRFYETYTDVKNDRESPQANKYLSAVANDDGKGPINGNKRITFQVKQDSGNSGLTLDAGSISAQIPGRFDIKFKAKAHDMEFNVTNTTDEEFEVVGAIKTDSDRPLVQSVIDQISIRKTPSSTTDAEVIMVSVDPSSTNYVDGDFSVPVEHSEQNSAIRQVEGDGAAGAPTGPDASAVGTDVDGAETANILTNPGGYQIGHASISSTSDAGGTSAQRTLGISRRRVLTDLDYGLIIIDSNEQGEHKVEIETLQNS